MVPERSSEVDGVHHGGDDGQRGGKVRSLINIKVNVKFGKCDGIVLLTIQAPVLDSPHA